MLLLASNREVLDITLGLKMCIAIIVTKVNVIIANIALEYFTIVNGAQHHPTRVLYMKSL